MPTLEYYFVDVFAEKKYSGNQLAVFRNAEGLTKEQMQTIAFEINFSETTFIATDEVRNGGFDVRIFTPGAEIPFAGHPTLGTTYIIKEKILQQNAERIILNLGVGQIPVDLTYANASLSDLWMKQKNPTFINTLSPEEVIPVLGISAVDLDANFPIEEVSTGIPFIIVPLKSLDVLRKIEVNRERYNEFIHRYNPDLENPDVNNTPATAFFVFCPEAYEAENDLNARMFDGFFGIPEDPATGSANGCFLSYLLKHNYFKKSELNLRVEQGYEIKRPSLIKIRGKKLSETEFDIFVGGKVQMVANGEWIV